MHFNDNEPMISMSTSTTSTTSTTLTCDGRQTARNSCVVCRAINSDGCNKYSSVHPLRRHQRHQRGISATVVSSAFHVFSCPSIILNLFCNPHLHSFSYPVDPVVALGQLVLLNLVMFNLLLFIRLYSVRPF